MSANPQRWYDAQVAVLGSVLINADKWAGEVVHRTTPEDYGEAYRPVFQVIRAKYAAGEPIDPVTVKVALGNDSGQMLMEIMQLTPTDANCQEYLELMLEQGRLLRLGEIGRQLQESHSMDDARALVDQANALTVRREKVRVVSMSMALEEFLARQMTTKREYLTWGLAPLDERLYVEGGDFVVLGGYPSDGKTALALSMAFHQGQSRRVGFFSFETNDHKLFDRLIPTLTRVDFGRVKKHDMSREDLTAITMRGQSIADNHLELVSAAGMTVSDIKAVCHSRRFEIIYIDYLQLIRPTDPRRSSFDQVTQISMDLHSLAQRTGVTVVALSQLTRPEKKDGETKAPGMHSLRQSGQIEQDADVIMFVYREDPKAKKSRRLLKVAKNKEGEAGGVVLLNFDGATQRFSLYNETPSTWKPRRDQIHITELPDSTRTPFDGGMK